MKHNKIAITFFIISTLTMVISFRALAGDLCYEKADPDLNKLKTWKDLRLWFENYSECDDGYYAEGISDFVVVTLAKRWETLPELRKEILKNKEFKEFVLKHIDPTTSDIDLLAVQTNSKTKCPDKLKKFCNEIHYYAQESLKVINETE